eukprot:TRINITY_DN25074_c0_g1_i1.p1 TRINITY_DN25074_c0_g1~~TRINITY_DN25074_c0_g1_i1.p1  ORF type:complete len:104 (-),score=17.43 TRINITY_DN25074_c0_g1_i1:169-480(-)
MSDFSVGYFDTVVVMSFFFLQTIRRPQRSTHCISSAASDVYKRQVHGKSLHGQMGGSSLTAQIQERQCSRQEDGTMQILNTLDQSVMKHSQEQQVGRAIYLRY